jgi:glycerate kinase
VLALASPASLKGVLPAPAAAAALVEGLRAGGADAEAVPVGDGGEGTLDLVREALPGAAAAVEAASVIGLGCFDDVMTASSRALGELILEALAGDPGELIVFLGGTGTVDGGAGLLEVVDELPIPTRAVCDVSSPLLDAVWVFAPQKGATPEQLPELEARLLSMARLAPYRELPGAGAAGGLGAALASLGAELVPGAPFVLELIGFADRLQGVDLVVTGEGTVDASTWLGKAPSAVAEACAEQGVRCAVFGGRVLDRPAGIELYELGGDPSQARDDLVELGRRLTGSSTA